MNAYASEKGHFNSKYLTVFLRFVGTPEISCDKLIRESANVPDDHSDEGLPNPFLLISGALAVGTRDQTSIYVHYWSSI